LLLASTALQGWAAPLRRVLLLRLRLAAARRMVLGFGASLVLNSVIVYPGVKWILTSAARWPDLGRRKALAVLFLACTGLASVGLDLVQVLDERNLFSVMQVARSADDKEVRTAYQRLARELHPDKNREDPSAEQRFIEMKEAYDVLANPALRQTYDRWGLDGLGGATKGEDVLSAGLLKLAITYVVWFALTILLTVQSSHTHSRTIALSGLALLLAVDLSLKTSGFAYTVPFFPHLTVYQITSLLFQVYPTFIAGTTVFQSFTYVDAVDRNWKLLSVVYQRQNLLMENLTTMENELRLTGKAGALPKIAGAGQTVVSAGPTAGLPRNLAAKNAAAGPGVDPSAVPQPEKKTGIPSWVWFLGFYVVTQFVLK
jgi:hypothetical protein